jgi:hypothetical protein
VTEAIDPIAREIAPPTTIRIDGVDHELRYNMRAVLLYKEKTGDNLFLRESLNKIGPADDPEKFLWCLWAGLQSSAPQLTREVLEEQLMLGDAAAILKAIFEAIVRSFPEARPGNPPEPETAPASPPAIETP